ncbi:hypothetical protein GXB85_12295 [Cellulomonas sp. APG4]|uniref:hypothetical protein n=1 Tax=Cellulomonas sp. APG4 TaxID=1538656 RepID=UPI00137B34FD|nr:hypothetical protein [Cellulomonas sp. APG4]NCT91726.1 hypothetical protein [Cellulomonas sp. APG4]
MTPGPPEAMLVVLPTAADLGRFPTAYVDGLATRGGLRLLSARGRATRTGARALMAAHEHREAYVAEVVSRPFADTNVLRLTLTVVPDDGPGAWVVRTRSSATFLPEAGHPCDLWLSPRDASAVLVAAPQTRWYADGTPPGPTAPPHAPAG